MKEALLYEPVADGKVVCTACARYCRIGEGQIGLCGVRQNLGENFSSWFTEKSLRGTWIPSRKSP